RALHPGAVHGEVADDIGDRDVLQFPSLRLPEGVRASHIGPVPAGQPTLEGFSLFHQVREEIPCKVKLFSCRDMIEDLRIADIHPGTCEIGKYLAWCRLLLEPLYFIVDIDLGDTIFTRVIY